jgi:hypothetical protein
MPPKEATFPSVVRPVTITGRWFVEDCKTSLFVLSLGVELAHSFTPSCQRLSELENMIQAGRFRLLLMIGCVGNGASCPAESGGRSPFHQEQAHAGQSAKMTQLSMGCRSAAFGLISAATNTGAHCLPTNEDHVRLFAPPRQCIWQGSSEPPARILRC